MERETPETIYPLTIVKDRYLGGYSGGLFIAFNHNIGEISDGTTETGFHDLGFEEDDLDCMDFWEHTAMNYTLAVGNTIDEAVKNLCDLINYNRKLKEIVQ